MLALLGGVGLGATACGAVNEAAATTTYNATFTGSAILVPPGGATAVPLTLSLTLSQLAATISGTAAYTTARGDTVLAAGVTGHTTPTGVHLTLVQPIGCAVTLDGAATLRSDGGLDGTLSGADCHATGTANLQSSFSLARR